MLTIKIHFKILLTLLLTTEQVFEEIDRDLSVLRQVELCLSGEQVEDLSLAIRLSCEFLGRDLLSLWNLGSIVLVLLVLHLF